MRPRRRIPRTEILVPAAALAALLVHARPAGAANGALPPVVAPPAATAPAPAPPDESGFVALPPTPEPAPAPVPVVVPAASWMRLGGTHFGFDVRLDVNGLFKVFVPDPERGGGGADAGGGAGLAGSFEAGRFYPPDPASGRSTWGGFAVGGGLALHYDAYAIGGIDPGVIGPKGIASGTVGFLEIEPSLFLAVRLGVGSFQGASGWRGVIFGVAWTPTYVYFTGTSRFDGGGAMHPAGIRATADIGSLDALRPGFEPIFRVTAGLLPHVNDLPTMVDLGFGVAFY